MTLVPIAGRSLGERSTRAREVAGAARLLVLVAGLLPCCALAQEAGGDVVRTGRVDEDLYAAGGSVDLRVEARDDVVTAGGRVLVDSQVGGSVLTAGGRLDVLGTVGNDVRAVGGTVRVGARIGDEATLAGGTVELLREASVAGRASLAGGTVEVAGSVGKDLRAAGGNVIVSGEVAGDAELAGGRITIRPSARIHGDLSYASAQEARIEPGARIDGKITHRVLEHRGRGWKVLWKVLWLAGLFAAALVLLLVFPRFSVAAAREAEAEPARCLGLGLLVLLGVPVAIVLLFATVVGIPLALAGTALYPVLLLGGYLTAAIALGDAGLRRLANVAEPSRAQRVLAVAVALVALRIVRLVPIAGALVLFAALLFGLGALALRGWTVYRGSGAGPPMASGAPAAPSPAV